MDDPRSKAMSWEYHLTKESKSREPCTLKLAAGKYLQVRDILSLGGGIPDPDLFPIENMSIFVHKAPFFSHVEGAPFTRTLNAKSNPSLPVKAVRTHDVAPPIRKRQFGKYELQHGREYDLAVALNYAQASGSPQMLRFITEHTELAHWPPYQDWACATSIGSTGALEQIFRMLLSRGDSLVTDEFAFSTMLETAKPLGVKTIGVSIDEEGIIPSALQKCLATWDDGIMGPRPKVLYVIPTGHNPTGTTMSKNRRHDIYLIAREHNLVIIEDDPYHFLQFNKSPAETHLDADQAQQAPPRHPELWATQDLTPSFLSMDVDGRVIRLDSLSKVFFPGVRMGWVTAPEHVIECFIRHNEVASQGPSGLSQAITHKIMDPEDGGWGHGGFFDWLQELKNQYQRRRDIIIESFDKHFGTQGLEGVASYEVPKAGMFVSATIP